MKSRISEFLAGLLFGLALMVSGMVDPGKVLAFLDLAGLWDPSLVLVMVGGIAVAVFAFAVAKKRTHALWGEPMQLPTARSIDRRLVVGSLLFGAGWGLAGFCPGPAIVATAIGHPKAAGFLVAMLFGMWLFERFERIARRMSGAATAAR